MVACGKGFAERRGRGGGARKDGIGEGAFRRGEGGGTRGGRVVSSERVGSCILRHCFVRRIIQYVALPVPLAGH